MWMRCIRCFEYVKEQSISHHFTWPGPHNYFHEHPCRNSDHCSWAQHWPAEIVLTRMPCFLPASNASTCSETTKNIFLETFRHVIRIIRLLEKLNATFFYKFLKCRKSAGSGKEVLCLASLHISWQLLKWSKTNFSWSLVWNKQFGLCGTHPSILFVQLFCTDHTYPSVTLQCCLCRTHSSTITVHTTYFQFSRVSCSQAVK